MFFGVAVNAAVSIGMTVSSAVNSFAANVMTAFRPQIIKFWSIGDKDSMQSLTILALKVISFIYCLVAIPCYVEIDNVLNLWLVNPPNNASIICRLFLLIIFFEVIKNVLTINVHASGHVKYLSMTSGTFYILIPFIVYVLFSVGYRVGAAFISLLITNAMMCFVNLIFVKWHNGISIQRYLFTILKILIISSVSLLCCLYIKVFIPDKPIHIITNTIIAFIVISILNLTINFSKFQRQELRTRILQRVGIRF